MLYAPIKNGSNRNTIQATFGKFDTNFDLIFMGYITDRHGEN
jgi:hypothetical protein